MQLSRPSERTTNSLKFLTKSQRFVLCRPPLFSLQCKATERSILTHSENHIWLRSRFANAISSTARGGRGASARSRPLGRRFPACSSTPSVGESAAAVFSRGVPRNACPPPGGRHNRLPLRQSLEVLLLSVRPGDRNWQTGISGLPHEVLAAFPINSIQLR